MKSIRKIFHTPPNIILPSGKNRRWCMLFISLTALSFSPVKDDCMEEVHRIYKSMKMEDLDKGNVYMNYTIVTHYKPDGKKPRKAATTNVELVIGKTQMHYKTPEALIYVDGKDNFTIMNEQKVIYWSASLLEVEKEKRIQSFTILQDSLFTHSKLIECKTKINSAEGYNKIVVMEPQEKAKSIYPYQHFTFYINTTEKKIKKVVIDFLPKFEFNRIELIYNKIELAYKKEDLSIPVKNKVLTANGKLNDTYKTYTLIDNRAKQK